VPPGAAGPAPAPQKMLLTSLSLYPNIKYVCISPQLSGQLNMVLQDTKNLLIIFGCE
jgi:hypothetical protein